ncbi:methyltransferase [Psychromonas aquimarina]|uniref:methyltransferase n=1 Tax=Psychromonas aquimarina TaxID=444919 RepID=UPI0003FE108B|nr:methyltransferase [Psychromonas aquimarina]
MNLVNAFLELDNLLHKYSSYWQFIPFQHHDYPWSNPALTRYVDELKASDFNKIDTQLERQKMCFSDFFPDMFAWGEKHQLAMSAQTEAASPFWLKTNIAGRKWQQIQAFSQSFPFKNRSIVEWCAGKGHLGRILAFHHQTSIDSIEWQAELCQQGQTQADKLQLPQKFIHADVLTTQAELLAGKQHVVAMHACGDLHTKMLAESVKHQVENIDLIPCCYHLTEAETYQSLSSYAQQSQLALNKDQIKMAVQSQLTGGNRAAVLRQKEVTWRLAYQALRADLMQDLHYVPIPSVNKSWFSGEFKDFACWCLQQHNLTAPGQVDWQQYLSLGEIRAASIQKMELVRHVFRRPLEMWLILDRALYLQEQGYQVVLEEFCDYQITPRNIVIRANIPKRHGNVCAAC